MMSSGWYRFKYLSTCRGRKFDDWGRDSYSVCNPIFTPAHRRFKFVTKSAAMLHVCREACNASGGSKYGLGAKPQNVALEFDYLTPRNILVKNQEAKCAKFSNVDCLEAHA